MRNNEALIREKWGDTVYDPEGNVILWGDSNTTDDYVILWGDSVVTDPDPR